MRKITREAHLFSKCSSPIQLDCLCPLLTCCWVAAETTSPPSQQRGWRRWGSPLLLIQLLHAAQLQAQAAWAGRSCVGAFVCKSSGPASLSISGEQFSAAAWEVPTAEMLNIQARHSSLIQGWEIIKRSALCCICISLLQYFLNGWVVLKIQVVFKTVFKCKRDISSTNHTFFRWKIHNCLTSSALGLCLSSYSRMSYIHSGCFISSFLFFVLSAQLAFSVSVWMWKYSERWKISDLYVVPSILLPSAHFTWSLCHNRYISAENVLYFFPKTLKIHAYFMPANSQSQSVFN